MYGVVTYFHSVDRICSATWQERSARGGVWRAQGGAGMVDVESLAQRLVTRWAPARLAGGHCPSWAGPLHHLPQIDLMLTAHPSSSTIMINWSLEMQHHDSHVHYY